ncbi:MAG: DUF1097 domain-containing protein [Clostridia bacterium]|nr:DUF1097 domain-containing protein [Clostridia bacterium]MDD4375912.1 DUF1097 domain-containing protein [Clostridia bacterium]
MNKLIKASVASIVIGTIAAILVIVDSFIASLIIAGTSFTWIAFINWTVFFNSELHERMRAIIGYIIGYFSANAIIFIGNSMGNLFDFKIINVSLASVMAVFIINFLVIYFQKAKKLFIDSIPGIFIGIALTFSGAGIMLEASNLKLLLIILIYGVLGLLCGLGTVHFTNKISDKIENKNK